MRNKIFFLSSVLFSLFVSNSELIAQQYQPLQISSGFNQDVIANGVGSPFSSSSSGIDASSYALLSTDYQFTVGGTTYSNAIPSNGMITSMDDASLTFQLNSLSANNSLRLANQNDSGVLVVSNPLAALGISVLVTSGDGASVVSGIITFTDNTTQIFSGLSIPDWYGSTALPTALWNMGRINRNTATVETPTNNPRLYRLDIDFNTSNYGKSVQSIQFTKTSSGGVANILAVSASLLGTCPPPISISAINGTSTSADFIWSSLGSEIQWEIIIQAEGSPAPGSGVSGLLVNSMTYFANFLQPGIGYDVYVRAVCFGSEYSIWSGPFNYYTPPANDNCSLPTTIPVNTGADCLQVVSGAFLGSTVSSEPNYCGATNNGDLWFDFTATSDVQTISLSNFAGPALPIVMTVYEGNDCSSLTQIFCSSVNYITATSLIVGQTYYVRTSINSSNTDHATTFDICVSTPDITSGDSLECLIETINSDFETPAFPSGTGWYNHNQVQGWRTTASDEVIEMWNNFQGVTAYSGNQFIELNANMSSGVYQDYETPVSTTFNFGFAHRGRLGTDSCGLYVGPPGGPYTLIFTASTGNTEWQYYTGSYTIPSGQTQTRFIFEAISTATGDLSVGNFLDAISFTANNGILSDNPVVLECDNNTADLILAGGVGTWIAHSDNPSPTVIEGVNSNTPVITGFLEPGVYKYDWTNLYCSTTLEINFSGNNVPAPEVEDITYCLGQTAVALEAVALEGYTLNWYTVAQDGTPLSEAPIPDTSVAGTTIYYVSQSSEASTCEGPRVPLIVTVNNPVSFTINGECEGVNYWLTVEGEFSDAVLYSWTNSANMILSEDSSFNVSSYLAQNSGISIPEGGITFYLDINDNGCESQSEFTVESVFCSIPRGISPNGDGLNDEFDLTGMNVDKLSIYNRYGKTVYEFSGDYTKEWKGQTNNGNNLPDATYYYYIKTREGKSYTGWVYVNKEY